jgi:hypothetical protein
MRRIPYGNTVKLKVTNKYHRNFETVCHWSRGSSVGIAKATDWMPRFDSLQRQEIFLYFTAYRTILVLTYSPIQWIP